MKEGTEERQSKQGKMNSPYFFAMERNVLHGRTDRDKDSRFTRAKLGSQSPSTFSWCPSCFIFIFVFELLPSSTRIEVTFTLLLGTLEAFWMRIKPLTPLSPPASLKCSDHFYPSWPLTLCIPGNSRLLIHTAFSVSQWDHDITL
jgi:hypothetical protein